MTSTLDRRAAILEAASRLFEHYGFGKTTVADVAREARVGVGTVYLEFESKETLVEALSLTMLVSVLESMRRAVERAPADPATRLSTALRVRTTAFLALRERGPHACELVHCGVERVLAAQQRFGQDERAFLAGIIDEGRRAGRFADCDSLSVAQTIQRAYASLSPPWLYADPEDPIAASDALCRLLLDGLLVKKVARKAAGRSASSGDARGRARGGRRSR